MAIYGMSELRFVKDPASDDYLAEGGDGEYYASHFEGEFIAAAWTCEQDGLRALLGVFEAVAEPGNFAIEAHLFGDRVVDEIDLDELQRLVHFSGHELEAMTHRQNNEGVIRRVLSRCCRPTSATGSRRWGPRILPAVVLRALA